MGLWDSLAQIYATSRFSGKVKLLIHCHTILGLTALSLHFQTCIWLHNIMMLILVWHTRAKRSILF